MMRITTLVFVCATIAGCSWGGDGGSGPSGIDASVGGGGGGGGSPVCGDGTCASSEVNNCPADCGSGGGGGGSGSATVVCGNGSCETGETSQSCPTDCGSGGGSGSGSTGCPANVQDCLFCAIIGQQCPTGMDMNSCTACLGTGPMSGTCNNDGVCDAAEMLDPTCLDCP